MGITSSVIDKLLAAGAVKIGKNKEPTFTVQFQRYLVTYAAFNKQRLQFVNGCRLLLGCFHLSLVRMTDEELATAAMLLQYQQRMTKSGADRRSYLSSSSTTHTHP